MQPDIRKGDDVLLTSNWKWYRVIREPYTPIVGYTCLPDCKPIYRDEPIFGGDNGRLQLPLQVSAVAEVWRDGVQVWPPEVEQLGLWED